VGRSTSSAASAIPQLSAELVSVIWTESRVATAMLEGISMIGFW
jgi:hypothetical protein